MKTQAKEWVVQVRHYHTHIVQTDKQGNVNGLIWAPWETTSGPYATKEEALRESEIVKRVEQRADKSAEVRVRRDRKRGRC